MNSQKQVKQYNSNKNDPQSSFERSNHTKLNELNSELAVLQSLVSEQIIYIKKYLQEINDLYQQNENTLRILFTFIRQPDDLKKKEK